MGEQIKKWLLSLSELIIKLRWFIVAAVVGLTVFFGYWMTKVQIDSDIINSLPDDDPVAKLYKETGVKYGGNYTALILLETDNVFTPQVLEDVKRITDTLQNLPEVSYVTSLTNIIDIKSSQWGIEIGKLVDEYDLPHTQAQLDSLRDRVFQKDMYHGVIVSDDSTVTVVMATLREDVDKQEAAKKIKQAVESLGVKEKVYFTGVPFILVDTSKIIMKDLRNLIPVAALIIIVILWLGFKSVRGVVLPLLTVGISIVWTIGLIALTGHKLTLVSDVIPVILLALGSAYAIHVLNRINETKAENPRKALILAIAYIITPVFLAYITTAFGFVSFIFGSYLTSIKEFGLFTAMGITFAFLLSITFIPALIDILKLKRHKEYKAEQSRLTEGFLQPLANRVIAKPKQVVWIWLVVVLLFMTGLPQLQRKVDMLSYYKKGSDVRVAQELVDQKLSGSQPVYVIFDGDVQSPEFLKKMKQFEDYMKSISPYLKHTMSVADLVEQMNDAMGEGMKIPDDKAKIEQLWFLIESEDIMSQLVSPDLDQAIIQAQFASWDTKVGREFTEELEDYAKKLSTDDIRIRVTGLPSVDTQLDISVLRSQTMSLLIAIVLMFTVVSITMWSVKCGYISLIPLIMTILMMFGFMGWMKIPLDTTTVVVASITLGVGIDYAIHIISHYRLYLQEKGDVGQAILETIRVSGNAIVINVLSVALGFTVLLLSDLTPIKNLGLIMALAMVIAGFAAITLLPAVIILLSKKSKS